jgi:hypothetical protein
MWAKTKRIGPFRSVGLLVPIAILMLAGWSSTASAEEPIVGFWQATWKDATSGDVVNNVWDVWHNDRTETQDDTTNTILSNVCQGAWVKLGERTYGLSHPGFNFLTSPPAPEDQEGNLDTSSSVLIFERVTVDKSGNTFSGTGIIKTIQGIDPYDPAAKVLGTENITITAKRVIVDVSQLPPT